MGSSVSRCCERFSDRDGTAQHQLNGWNVQRTANNANEVAAKKAGELCALGNGQSRSPLEVTLGAICVMAESAWPGWLCNLLGIKQPNSNIQITHGTCEDYSITESGVMLARQNPRTAFSGIQMPTAGGMGTEYSGEFKPPGTQANDCAADPTEWKETLVWKEGLVRAALEGAPAVIHASRIVASRVGRNFVSAWPKSHIAAPAPLCFGLRGSVVSMRKPGFSGQRLASPFSIIERLTLVGPCRTREGDVFEGEFRNGKMHGKGLHRFVDCAASNCVFLTWLFVWPRLHTLKNSKAAIACAAVGSSEGHFA
eukprot:4773990-Pleurochrysis_carterae.AAC.3